MAIRFKFKTKSESPGRLSLEKLAKTVIASSKKYYESKKVSIPVELRPGSNLAIAPYYIAPGAEISEERAGKIVTKEFIGKEFAGIRILPKGESELGIHRKLFGTKLKLAPEVEEGKKNINLVYPLVPKRPKKGDIVFAYVNIKWDKKRNELVYYVREPGLAEEEKKILINVKEILQEKLDVDLSKIRKIEAVDFLMGRTEETFSTMGVDLSEERKEILKYYIRRDFIGFERIEPMLNDEQIEDISCDGVGIPMYIFHRNPVIGSVKTNIEFYDSEDLDLFLIKLAQRCGKTISIAEPLLNGALPDGSRVQATLGTDIARRGSNFTIRMFTEVPLTPIDLLNYETINPIALAYLWMCIEYGQSILIGGGTATGKTTLLNVLSLFIKPTSKIVSIEDTPELKLPHPHWVPEVARTAIAEVGGKEIGEVDMFDLLKESMRQRPDYIIVGEVRGKEAYVLFQQMATGHPGLSTIHADSLPKLIDRLETPPISLPPGLLENLDIIIFLSSTKVAGRFCRKVTKITEVVGLRDNYPIVKDIFTWNPETNILDNTNESVLLKKIGFMSGLSEISIQKEIRQRANLLAVMQEKNVTNFKDASKILELYYYDPERVIELIERL